MERPFEAARPAFVPASPGNGRKNARSMTAGLNTKGRITGYEQSDLANNLNVINKLSLFATNGPQAHLTNQSLNS